MKTIISKEGEWKTIKEFVYFLPVTDYISIDSISYKVVYSEFNTDKNCLYIIIS